MQKNLGFSFNFINFKFCVLWNKPKTTLMPHLDALFRYMSLKTQESSVHQPFVLQRKCRLSLIIQWPSGMMKSYWWAQQKTFTHQAKPKETGKHNRAIKINPNCSKCFPFFLHLCIFLKSWWQLFVPLLEYVTASHILEQVQDRNAFVFKSRLSVFHVRWWAGLHHSA